MKEKKTPIFKRLMVYSGNKGYMLYLAMILSAVSGISLLMPIVYIHKIIQAVILENMIQVDVIMHHAIHGTVFAVVGLVLYLGALILSHHFAFEVEDNIVKLSVKRMMDKPLGYFANHESGKIKNVIVDGRPKPMHF